MKSPTAPAPTSSRAPYREEIQGLRAVAALLVATYHIWFGRVSGGVDVFIVVSAFLVTTSLLRQVENGRIDFLAFWRGLARRLLPAAITVLFATVVASILLMPRSRWIATIGDVVASALYVENWLLAFRSVDYLAQSVWSSPLQHFWALSIQGQLYVVWPVLIATAAYVARKGGFPIRTALLAAVTGTFLVSLAYSVVRTAVNQPFTYFDTMARVWEFSLGAMFAIALPWLRLTAKGRIIAGWVGLLAILSCGLVLQVSTVFPGYAALWPTLGAMLILIAHDSGSRLGADRLLSMRPLTWLGGRSYAIYLWHWPIFVFYRVVTNTSSVSIVAGVSIIVLSVLLAELTTRFVEQPIRYTAATPKRRLSPALAGSLGLATFTLCVALWATYSMHMKRVDGRVLTLDDPMYPGAAAMMPGAVPQPAPDVPVHPGPMAVKSDRPSVYQKDCFQSIQGADPLSCDFGRIDAELVIAAVGGSYVAHWMPALQWIALQEGWRVATYTKNRCWFSTEERVVFGEEYESCELWNDNVIDELLQERPDVVFTRATRASGNAEMVPDGFVEQWRRLSAAGIRVVAVRKTPRFPFDVPDCVTRYGADSERCTVPRTAALAATSPTAALEGRLPGVHFIDLSDYFCDALACPPVIGNILVYSDDSHMTTHYARSVAPMLRDEMRAALSDLLAETRAH